MSKLLMSGFDLMFLGMITVFVFLTILVLGTQLMSYTLGQLVGPDKEIQPSQVPAVDADGQEVAAVVAAVSSVYKSLNQ